MIDNIIIYKTTTFGPPAIPRTLNTQIPSHATFRLTLVPTYGSVSNLLKIANKFEPNINLTSSPRLSHPSNTGDIAPLPALDIRMPGLAFGINL